MMLATLLGAWIDTRPVVSASGPAEGTFHVVNSHLSRGKDGRAKVSARPRTNGLLLKVFVRPTPPNHSPPLLIHNVVVVLLHVVVASGAFPF